MLTPLSWNERQHASYSKDERENDCKESVDRNSGDGDDGDRHHKHDRVHLPRLETLAYARSSRSNLYRCPNSPVTVEP